MKTNWILVFSALSIFLLFGCSQYSKEEKKKSEINAISYSEEELYRPNFHFIPKANWMNDPIGIFYPNSNVWGSMHWGYATSEDLIIWEEQSIPIYPDSLGYIFSGSAVVDKNNSSGFGIDLVQAIVAMYIYHDMDGET